MSGEERFLPFFVYGTLLPGQPNATLWQELVQETMPATLQPALLYDMGHFPMLIMVEPSQGKAIQGMLLIPTIETYTDLIHHFDDLEGYDTQQPEQSVYQRQAHMVCTSGGEEVLAWVYVGQSQYVEALQPLEKTSWNQYASHKADEINEWWANFETLFP